MGMVGWASGIALAFAVGLENPAQCLPQGLLGPQALVDTRIEAAYFDDTRRLDGTVTQVWTNPTSDTVHELWFHLYWNAFSNNRSTFLTESGGRLRSHVAVAGQVDDNEWGWQRVVSVIVDGEQRVATLRYRQPDGGSPDDRSVFSVDLAEPLAPGATVTAVVRWESRVPRARRRTGYKDDFLMVGHWFPKLGVYQAGRGWNCHEFHERSEFFGNWGTYDVELDLPVRYEGKVFATGVPLPPSERRGDRVITRFQAPSTRDRARVDSDGRAPLVHDFAWTADPDVKPRRATFHFDDWRTRYPEELERVQRALGPDRAVALSDVEVWVLMQPEREDLWRRHFEATCAALYFYGLWFGEYPFERVTVVDPPWGAPAVGGMEYPLLFTVGASLFTPESMLDFESTAVHEAGHQFLYGILANNEFEEAWLDEGLNSWADNEALSLRYGPRERFTDFSGVQVPGVGPFASPGGSVLGELLAARSLAIPWTGLSFRPQRASGLVDYWREFPPLTFVRSREDLRWVDRCIYLPEAERGPFVPSWRYPTADAYRIHSYYKPAVALRSLPAVLGEDGDLRLLRGLRRYADAARFRHATTDDFVREFSAGAGEDLGWYFRELFFGSGTVDWSIAVQQTPVAKPMGYVQSEPGANFEFVEPSSDDAPPAQRLEITVSRAGELCLPVDVRWTFDDGTSETVRWTREEQQRSRWMRFTRIGPRRCVSAAIDPDRRYYLDADMSDNRWYARRDVVAPWRWTERAFSQAAQWLFFQGGLGG